MVRALTNVGINQYIQKIYSENCSVHLGKSTPISEDYCKQLVGSSGQFNVGISLLLVQA